MEKGFFLIIYIKIRGWVSKKTYIYSSFLNAEEIRTLEVDSAAAVGGKLTSTDTCRSLSHQNIQDADALPLIIPLIPLKSPESTRDIITECCFQHVDTSVHRWTKYFNI